MKDELRKYMATYDTGHDYGSFEFYSNHRAGSKANLEDAISQARKTMSYSMFKKIKITETCLSKEC